MFMTYESEQRWAANHGPRDARRTRPRRWTGAAGFTLIEMIVALAVVAILASVAAPAMGDFMRDNRLRATTQDLLQDMHFARSEAVKRKVRVVLCRSSNPLAAVPTCSGTFYTWTTGYLVFASGDANNTYEAATDELLRIGNATTDDVTLRSNDTANRNLEYNVDGTTNEGGGTALFAVCDGRGGAHGRQIEVPPVGRPRLVKGTGATPINCTTPA